MIVHSLGSRAPRAWSRS